MRRESERVGRSGLAGTAFGRFRVGLSAADMGIEGYVIPLRGGDL